MKAASKELEKKEQGDEEDYGNNLVGTRLREKNTSGESTTEGRCNLLKDAECSKKEANRFCGTIAMKDK